MGAPRQFRVASHFRLNACVRFSRCLSHPNAYAPILRAPLLLPCLSMPPGIAPKIGFVSLGCPKALVDSERILTQLRVEGYQIVPTYKAADVVVVNTCGFIDAAVAESLDAIGEAMSENGKVVVTGCLGARADMIRERFPDVLSISGPADYASVMRAVHAQMPPQHDPFLDLVPPQGVKLTPRHYAYLKISEGCNHRCSFCIIPSLRGDLVSRPIDEVLIEAEKLARSGVKELLVVSQDTSAYGVDTKYTARDWRGQSRQTRFLDLAQALGELGIWVRMHYVYPYPHVDKVVPLMAQGAILPYLDIPFQHSNPRILKLMKRPASGEKNIERIRAWREICPDITLRSTFIVGFPGETDAEFEGLLQFLQEAQLDRVGAFAYSPVGGAPANDLPDPVPEELKQERLERFMSLQSEISAARLQRKIGSTQRVLIDEVGPTVLVARSESDAPEIDGKVYVGIGSKGRRKAAIPKADAVQHKPGDFVDVRIVDADEHDLHAVLA